MKTEDDMAGYAKQGAPSVLGAITKLDLDLKIISVANGVATFTLEGKDHEDKKHVSNGKITIPPSSRGVKIEFDLHDNGLGLEYFQTDPIWVSRVEECPKSHCTDTQIVDVQAHQNKLKMKDLNTEDVVLGYQIILVGAEGQVTVDPIIKNQP